MRCRGAQEDDVIVKKGAQLQWIQGLGAARDVAREQGKLVFVDVFHPG